MKRNMEGHSTEEILNNLETESVTEHFSDHIDHKSTKTQWLRAEFEHFFDSEESKGKEAAAMLAKSWMESALRKNADLDTIFEARKMVSRMMYFLPLTPIENIEEQWIPITEDIYHHARYADLYRIRQKDGSCEYRDSRAARLRVKIHNFKRMEDDVTLLDPIASMIHRELHPVTFPYRPSIIPAIYNAFIFDHPTDTSKLVMQVELPNGGSRYLLVNSSLSNDGEESHKDLTPEEYSDILNEWYPPKAMLDKLTQSNY